jgi:hypothetical protein
MVWKITLEKLCFSALLSLLFISNSNGYAQTIMIGTPNLGFTQACASTGFNNYSLTFTVFPLSNLQAGNQLIIELSDSTGNFGSPTTLTTTTSTTSPVSVSFAIPTNTAGEAFKIRVKSTAPAATSPVSVSFSAYFAVHNQPFSINNNVGTVSFCEGGNTTLLVDNSGTASSPLFYTGLTYKWYRNFAEVPGATSPSLNVTQTGNYYAIVDYGSCVMNSYSNMVTVNVTAGINLSITAAGNVEYICDGSPRTLTSSHQNSGYTYQWFKNSVAITGATNATYNATQEGIYKLRITFGGCVFESNSIFLELIDLQIDWNVNTTEVLIPGEQLQINSINNATTPTFQWKKNNVIIAGATTANYTVTEAGTYQLTVTETQGCTISEQLTVVVQYPIGFSATIQNSGDYQSCISTTSTLSLNTLMAQTSTGNVAVNLPNPNFSYQWLLNNVAIAGATSTSYTVANATQNGSYKLRVTIPTFSPIESNAISIALQIQTPVITAVGTLCGTNSVQLNSSVTNAVFTYKWYKNNTLITGASSPSYSTNQAGNYHLVVSLGSCSVTSNTINLQQNSISATLNIPTTAILIPGETKVITATTNAVNPSFQWYRNNAIITGATSASINATTDGTYKVIVTQTTGCNATQEASCTLIYPTSFAVTIAADSNYVSCTSEQTSLSLSSFNAISVTETLSLLGNSYNYTYEWYKNGSLVLSSAATSFLVTSSEENGTYELRVVIPQFNEVISNELPIQLGSASAFEITSEGLLCESGGSVELQSNLSNPNYILTWYTVGNDNILGTEPSLTVTNPGEYYLTIAFEGCEYTSNSITLNVTTSDGISLNVSDSFTILEGSSTEVIASGVENYTWYLNNEEIGTGASLQVSVAGEYTVIGSIGDCEFTKSLSVTSMENTSIVIPNIISINNDGINDFWSIPNQYVNKEEVEVIIYSPKGKVVFRARKYQNNWPNNGLEYSKKEPVFYYTISNQDEIVKRGSITIIE